MALLASLPWMAHGRLKGPKNLQMAIRESPALKEMASVWTRTPDHKVWFEPRDKKHAVSGMFGYWGGRKDGKTAAT